MAPHICSVLQTLNASSADKPLLFCKDRQRTGPELVARVWALRRSLEEDIGLRCGDRVVLLALNTDQFLEVLLAVAAAGGVTAPINHRWSTQEALASVQRLRPRLLVVDGSCAELGSQLQAALPEHTTAVCLGDGNFPFPVMARAVSAEYLISRSMYGSSFASEALQAPDDGAALICFTSGTSGTSKGAVISHGALVGQALCKITMAGYRKGDTYLHAAPLFHIGGLSYAIAMLAVGARHIFLPRFTSAAMQEALQTREITATILVPAILEEMLSTSKTGVAWPCLRSIVIGAGRATTRQLQGCKRLFPAATIHCAYGMTEAASTIAWRLLASPSGPDIEELDAAAEGAHASAANCVGWPCPLTEVIVVAQAGRRSQPGEEGEIWTRGFHTMLGYWGLPDETRAAKTPDGWLLTGDLGCVDKEGRLWVTGRKKDVIRSGSENVHAAEVEAVLTSHPGVAAAAAVGIPDNVLGERVACLLQLSPGWMWAAKAVAGEATELGYLDIGILQRHCRAMGLSRYKVPRDAAASLDPLPANAVGKVLKHLARDRLLQLLREGQGPRSRM